MRIVLIPILLLATSDCRAGQISLSGMHLSTYTLNWLRPSWNHFNDVVMVEFRDDQGFGATTTRYYNARTAAATAMSISTCPGDVTHGFSD